MKILTKIAKIHTHENLNKNVNENMFHDFFFIKVNQNNKYVTALYCSFLKWFLIHLKWRSSSIWTASNFLNFDGPNAIFPEFHKPLATTSEKRASR